MNIRTLPLKRFWLVVGFLIFSAVAIRVPAQQPIAADKPQVGIRVFEVGPDTPAQRAGLKPNDVIVKFGDFAVVDTATYFVARDTLEKSRRYKPHWFTGVAKKDLNRWLRTRVSELDSTISARWLTNWEFC